MRRFSSPLVAFYRQPCNTRILMKCDIYWMSAQCEASLLLSSERLIPLTFCQPCLTQVAMPLKSEQRIINIFLSLSEARCTERKREIMSSYLTIQLCARGKESPSGEKLNELAIRKYYEVKRRVLKNCSCFCKFCRCKSAKTISAAKKNVQR